MEKKGGIAIKCMDMVLLEEGNVSGFGIFPLTAGYETLAFWSLFFFFSVHKPRGAGILAVSRRES